MPTIGTVPLKRKKDHVESGRSKSLSPKGLQNRLQKVVFHGIEVDQELVWTEWETGRQYSKKIVIKNVLFVTQKLDFKEPTNAVFHCEYPKTITLSPGTSFTLPITFQPFVRTEYHDSIVFQIVNGEQFIVPIKALLPQFKINIPLQIACGLVAAHDSIYVDFPLINESELVTPFKWLMKAPYSVEPSEGTLQPFETLNIRIKCQPESPNVYVLDAVCCYGTNYQLRCSSTFEAIAKFTHVVFSVDGKRTSDVLTKEGDLLVDFGTTFIGQKKEKIILLENPSTVPASVSISRQDKTNPHDWVFDCPTKSNMIVPPKTSLNISVYFTPKLPFCKSMEYFHVNVSNKCGNMIIKCLGTSSGPNISMSSQLINFFQLFPNESATQPLQLMNNTDSPLLYQFQLDPKQSVFTMDHVDGLLKPYSKTNIVITFRPSQPIQYYRRVALIVPDQEPMFLDLLGTCHEQDLRPIILQSRHLSRWRTRKERGLSYFAPEQLASQLDNRHLQLDDNGAVMLKQAEDLEIYCNSVQPLSPIKEYFYEEGDSDVVYSVPHVSLEMSYVDFGRVKRTDSANVRKSLCVKNNTKGSILIDWMRLDHESSFHVEPAHSEIPPGRTITCEVIFTSKEVDRIFGCELEGFAYFKSQREFQISRDETIAPPWCLTIRCLAHTFRSEKESFQPQFEFDRSQVIFPAVTINESAFRSITMNNKGEQPIYYRFDNLNDPFSIKPSMGVIPIGRIQIFTVRCLPSAIKQHVKDLIFALNDRESFFIKVPLLGSADEPNIFLPNNAELYLMPTNVGNSTVREYCIKNISRIPILYQWKIHHSETGIISVEPSSGRIEPNENVSQKWTFSPMDNSKRVMKPVLITKGLSILGAETEPKVYTMRLIGQGKLGNIKAVEEYLDFGILVVGTSATKTVTLVNESDCPLFYQLMVNTTIDGPYSEVELSRDPPSLELSQAEGWLPARCKTTIRATVRPFRRVCYQHQLAFQLMPNEDSVPRYPLDPEPRHLCHLLTTGCFPILTVTDVQGFGSTRSLSKRQLWNYFSLDNFNICLDSDPSVAELIYSVATRQSHERSPPVYTRAILDFNFGAASINAEASEFRLLLENPGHVPTEFNFLFPEQLQYELEYWAETGEYTHEELHQMKVQDNQLFKVEPSHGLIQAGANRIITFTYQHKQAGTDRLPVLLKIDKGREILLNFIGVTVEPKRLYIHFPSSKHVFTPVPIGEAKSPTQTYEMHNGGNEPLFFQFDLTQLEELRVANHDVVVFECLTPTGQILPGRSAQIKWIFTPLEARTYMVDIPIHIVQGSSALITFIGIGFDKRNLGNTSDPLMELALATGPPTQQTIPLPGQLAFLSEERLSFGNQPLYGRARRIVFVNNKSAEHDITFRWHVTNKFDADFVAISPRTGRLAPKQSAMCHVTFLAKGLPQFFDIDLLCEIIDETSVAAYERDLADWEEELRRQREEFTITENDLWADKRLKQSVKRRPPLSESQIPDEAVRSASAVLSETTNNRYQTLPPITEQKPASAALQRSSGVPGSTADIRARRQVMRDYWRKPEAPKSFVLHLGVTGRTHTIPEFKQHFQHLWNIACIDRALMAEQQDNPRRTKSQSTQKQSMMSHFNEIEAHIVEQTLNNVLYSLLQDDDFKDAVAAVPSESLPYYIQFGNAKQLRPLTPVEQVLNERESSGTNQTNLPVQLDSLNRVTSENNQELIEIFNNQKDDNRRTGAGASTTLSISEQEEGSARSSLNIERKAVIQEEEEKIKQEILESPLFGVICENILENMLTNIMAEANRAEVDLTARPRLIALPPRRLNSAQNRYSSSAKRKN